MEIKISIILYTLSGVFLNVRFPSPLDCSVNPLPVNYNEQIDSELNLHKKKAVEQNNLHRYNPLVETIKLFYFYFILPFFYLCLLPAACYEPMLFVDVDAARHGNVALTDIIFVVFWVA